MTLSEQIITIAMCVLGTVSMRFIPFILFNEHRKTPAFIHYLGKFLPSAVFGMLVIYCLRNVDFLGGNHGLPELIAIAFTVVLHLTKRQMLLSIAGGTIVYMVLVNLVFLSSP